MFITIKTTFIKIKTKAVTYTYLAKKVYGIDGISIKNAYF